MADKIKNEITHDDLVKMTAESTGNNESVVDSCVVGYGDNMAKAVNEAFENNPDLNKVSVFSPIGGYIVERDNTADGEARNITPLIGTNFFDEVNADNAKIKALKENEDKSEAASA